MHIIGNCVDSFDLDGRAADEALPFSDTTEFAQAIENSVQIDVGYPTFLKTVVPNPERVVLWNSELELYFVYNPTTDVHWIVAQ